MKGKKKIKGRLRNCLRIILFNLIEVGGTWCQERSVLLFPVPRLKSESRGYLFYCNNYCYIILGFHIRLCLGKKKEFFSVISVHEYGHHSVMHGKQCLKTHV